MSEPPPTLITQTPEWRAPITLPLIKHVGLVPIYNARTDTGEEQQFEKESEPRAALRLSSSLA
jgi:hypothetical protein